MKNLTVVLAASVSITLLAADSASARPDYFKQFQAHYKDSKVIEAVKESKCFTCHYGKKKANRNDYGTALSKHLTKKVWTELRRDKPALRKKVDEVLILVEKEKSVSGTPFGDLIKEGVVPGTPPEDAE